MKAREGLRLGRREFDAIKSGAIASEEDQNKSRGGKKGYGEEAFWNCPMS